MPYIAGYLLKLSVSLSVVYLFYMLVLRRLTFYNWNRWYLLGYSFLAFLIPFVNISPVLQSSTWSDSTLLQLIPVFGQVGAQHYSDNTAESGITYWSWIFMALSVGILIMGVRFLVRYISYRRICKSAELLVDEDVKIYHVDQSIIPFSFGKNIFINRQLHSENDLQQIIQHEFIHVKQKHTIDILWCELLVMLNWYNPFSWLIRKSMRQNLEFIADQQVIGNGIDKKHYQYLLLKVTGGARFSITQQFNFTSLKKRIVMMNRARSARVQLIRFLFLLPLVSVLLLAFRSNMIERRDVEETKAVVDWVRAQVGEEMRPVTDTLPPRVIQPDWVTEFLKRNPSVKGIWLSPHKNSRKSTSVTVMRKDGTREQYDLELKEGKELFEKRYGAIPGNLLQKISGVQPDKPDSTQVFVLDASVGGPGNPYRGARPEVLFVIDGEVQEDAGETLHKLNPEDIVSMEVLKGETAVALYGDKVKEGGVIRITTRRSDRVYISGIRKVQTNDSVIIEAPSITIKGYAIDADPLYVVEGIEVSAAEFAKMKVEPERIESVTVLKSDSATRAYGPKARHGVIIIKLKKPLTYNNNEPDTEEINALIRGSEKLIWHAKGRSFAVTCGGSHAITTGDVNLVVIDDHVYKGEEANRLFKRSQFTGVSFHPSIKGEFGIDAPAFRMHRQ